MESDWNVRAVWVQPVKDDPATAPQGESAVDHDRRTLSVPRRLMPVILGFHSGDHTAPKRSLNELEGTGVLRGGLLDPMVTTMVEVMTNPLLVVTVEVAGGRSPRLSTIWSTPHRAVVGQTSDRSRFDLVQIEPELLPFHLAQLTGLAPRPLPPFSGEVTLPSAALDLAEDLISSDPDLAEANLMSAGTPAEWIDRLLIALAHRRTMWTVESVWLGRTTGRSEARLAVLDAGPAGYWRLHKQGDGRVTVTASDFDDIMRRFSALLPPANAVT